MRHKHHSFSLIPGSSFFRVNGKQYAWKNHKKLVEQNKNVVLAKFEGVEGEDRIGRLIITGDGKDFAELAIVTLLVDHQRKEEKNVKVLIFVLPLT
jgi:hypothetical protein